MALPIVKVHSLDGARNLLNSPAPYHVILLGVDRVGDAPAMLATLEALMGKHDNKDAIDEMDDNNSDGYEYRGNVDNGREKGIGDGGDEEVELWIGGGGETEEVLNKAVNVTSDKPKGINSGDEDELSKAVNPTSDKPKGISSGEEDELNKAVNPTSDKPKGIGSGEEDELNKAVNPTSDKPKGIGSGEEELNKSVNPTSDTPKRIENGEEDKLNKTVNLSGDELNKVVNLIGGTAKGIAGGVEAKAVKLGDRDEKMKEIADVKPIDYKEKESYKLEEEEERGTEWVIDGLVPLRRTARLAWHLSELRQGVIPRLANDPGDSDAINRLRTLGHGIRCVGREDASDLCSLASKLGNHIKKVASNVVSHRRNQQYLAAQLPSLLQHVTEVYNQHYISLI